MSLHDVLAALSRARMLVADLDRSDRPEDRRQVAAGVRHELDAALVALRNRLEDERATAVAATPGKVRSDASGTSRAAAEAVAPRRGSAAWAILSAIAESPAGLTDHEIQLQTMIMPSTERPRRGELVDGGYVRNTGCSRQHGGSLWSIWEATDKGRDTITTATGRAFPKRESNTLF